MQVHLPRLTRAIIGWTGGRATVRQSVIRYQHDDNEPSSRIGVLSVGRRQRNIDDELIVMVSRLKRCTAEYGG